MWETFPKKYFCTNFQQSSSEFGLIGFISPANIVLISSDLFLAECYWWLIKISWLSLRWINVYLLAAIQTAPLYCIVLCCAVPLVTSYCRPPGATLPNYILLHCLSSQLPKVNFHAGEQRKQINIYCFCCKRVLFCDFKDWKRGVKTVYCLPLGRRVRWRQTKLMQNLSLKYVPCY